MVFRPSLPLFRSRKAPPSTRQWLARHFSDPYVRKRLSDPGNYRSRSAFKLIELDDQWKFLKPKDVNVVVDLGAAPGGWSQVVSGKLGWKVEDVSGMERAMQVKEVERKLKSRKGKREQLEEAERAAFDGSGFGSVEEEEKEEHGLWSSGLTAKSLNPDPLVELGLDDPSDGEQQLAPGRGTIIAVDLLPIHPMPGVKTLQMNFLSSETSSYIHALVPPENDGKVDVILSDMAANFSGNRTHDVEASLDICRAVFQFTKDHLRTADSIGRTRGGVLLLKHFAHPLTTLFRQKYLQPNFHTVQYVKPESSRSESAEGYWICMGWKPKIRTPRPHKNAHVAAD